MKATILSIFILASASTFVQTTEKTGNVSGVVRNGSTGNAPVAGQEVVLYTVKNGQEVDAPRPHVVADSQGRFAFENLEIGESTAYYPMAVYRDVQYSGPLVLPKPDALQQQSDVAVFETTASDSTISAAMHHIIIEPAEGVLSVREVYQFQNRGNHTFIGNPPAGADMKIGLQFEIPQLAQELQVGGNLMTCCTIVEENKVYDTMEFKPGDKQAVLNYRLPYEGSEAGMSKIITAQTDMLDVYVPEPAQLARLHIQGANATNNSDTPTGEPFQLRGKKYIRYMLSDISKSSVLSLGLSNLPAAPRDFRWLAPVALVLAIGAGYVFYRKRAKNEQPLQPDDEIPDDPAKKRRELVDKILALDDQFETGAIDEEVYLPERENLMEQVLAIDAQLQPENGSPEQ
jgi:hypothetical protein